MAENELKNRSEKLKQWAKTCRKRAFEPNIPCLSAKNSNKLLFSSLDELFWQLIFWVMVFLRHHFFTHFLRDRGRWMCQKTKKRPTTCHFTSDRSMQFIIWVVQAASFFEVSLISWVVPYFLSCASFPELYLISWAIPHFLSRASSPEMPVLSLLSVYI